MYYTLKLVKLQILEQHFQCWCYSYSTSTCLTAKATSVLTHLIKIGVFKGDATNLVNVPTESQAKVIIENPDGFDPLNPEILRVVKEGGEIEITGIKSNKKFFNIYSGKVEVPKGFEIIEVL